MNSFSDDRLGANLFPASSQQRVSDENAGGRNKIALKPGRSLMDWIRLTHSGKDLTGVDGQRLDVSPDDLALHGKPDNAWICLKGKVYNVSAYLDFHPGGPDELMRGAGKDATDLFNEVHKWVNFESMLEKCLVGRLRPPSAKGRSPLERDLMKSLARNISADSERDSTNPSNSKLVPKDISMPNYDWFQTEKSVNIVIYTKCKETREHDLVVDLRGRILRLLLDVKRQSYLVHLEFEGDVKSVINVRIGRDSGSMELFLNKVSPLKMWSRLGKPLEGHESFLSRLDRDIYFRECTLTKKCQLNGNTFLLALTLPKGTILKVPIGHHIRAKVCVQGVHVIRSYTPVISSLIPRVNSEENITWPHDTPSELHLIVKIYDKGVFTSFLNTLQIGDSLLISDPDGSFDENRLMKCDRLLLLAAGTGLTPMIRLVSRFLLDLTTERQVKLMFFNKTENDILLKDELAKLAESDNRFESQNVLSEPSEEWLGLRGRIRSRLLENFFPSPAEVTRSATVSLEESAVQINRPMQLLICVCGPKDFTEAAKGCLKQLGYSSNDIHAFEG